VADKPFARVGHQLIPPSCYSLRETDRDEVSCGAGDSLTWPDLPPVRPRSGEQERHRAATRSAVGRGHFLSYDLRFLRRWRSHLTIFMRQLLHGEGSRSLGPWPHRRQASWVGQTDARFCSSLTQVLRSQCDLDL